MFTLMDVLTLVFLGASASWCFKAARVTWLEGRCREAERQRDYFEKFAERFYWERNSLLRERDQLQQAINSGEEWKYRQEDDDSWT